MGTTTDPNDPRLGRGADSAPKPQNEVYLVLSEAEKAKGFVRPVRTSYVHVGPRPPANLRDLTFEEQERYAGHDYAKYEEYPDSEDPRVGRFWTTKQLQAAARLGCGTITRMNQKIAETYARNPHFYGSTYCVSCGMHLPVDEFVWAGTDERVGS